MQSVAAVLQIALLDSRCTAMHGWHRNLQLTDSYGLQSSKRSQLTIAAVEQTAASDCSDEECIAGLRTALFSTCNALFRLQTDLSTAFYSTV